MSVYQFPDVYDAPEVQIWNNAAFDNGETEVSGAGKHPFANLMSDSDSEDGSFECDWSKENQNPVLVNSSFSSSLSIKSAASIGNPLYAVKTPTNPSKAGFVSFSGKSNPGKVKQESEQVKKHVYRNIDVEIEEIEKEIRKLSIRLENLRSEKAEQTARTLTVRGRHVPAKFMEQKPTKIENAPFSNAKSKINRRGMSLGPSEIFSAARTEQISKPETTMTPLLQQNRRKSCFWKLQDIDEEQVKKGPDRRISLSLSPKSRKAASKIHPPKHAATTVGSKRIAKKDERILSTIQPKNLFKDGEKSAKTAKKPLKSGRMVASRYSLISNNSQIAEKDARKRSLPENYKEDGTTRCEKRRASDENGNQKNVGSRVKKRWEIPSEVVVYKSDIEMDHQLRKIRTFRSVAESPRDSGPVKRVAELVGKKSIFSSDEGSVCQSLSFDAEGLED